MYDTRAVFLFLPSTDFSVSRGSGCPFPCCVPIGGLQRVSDGTHTVPTSQDCLMLTRSAADLDSHPPMPMHSSVTATVTFGLSPFVLVP